jgi:hypothetical protein
MFTLFARASRYASLTPAERAFLRLLEGLAYTALLGAANACVQYLGAHPGASSPVDWQPVLRTCAAGAAVAVLMALAKYFKAHGDPALGVALAAAGAQLAPADPPTSSSPVPLETAPVAADGMPGGMADAAAAPPDGAVG